MDATRRTRVKEVYLAASGQKREDRQRYLDEACGEDEAMRREVESLLLERDQTAAGAPGPGPMTSPVGIPDAIGRYRIISLVGEGGMGRVYEAEDPELERRIALKVLPESLAEDPKALERFKREARTVAALSHPNIVTLHSVEESEGTHFLTMELVRGEPLSRLIPEDGFDVKEILEWAIPLADGLRAAHEQGIVHRDLKPGNVMVDRDGRVRILDFGLARLHTELSEESQEATMTALTALGTIVGTVPYMSPEQVSGKPADQRSDIFSLGIILYEMCTGHRPFSGETATHTMSAILRDRPERVSEIRGDLPEHLGRIVRRCLEKEPEKRYQTAEAVRDELGELKHEMESGSTRLHQASRTTKPSPTRLWIGLAASLAVLAVVAFFSFWSGGQHSDGPDEVAAQVSPATLDRKMIAVLPFENLGSSDDEYFAAGMTDEINSRLSQVRGLGVISRDSAALYAETEKTTSKIGEELGVEYLLGGTVRWAHSSGGDSRLRITPRLVRVADDTQLWSDSYDRVLDDVFDIQSDIAVQVVAQLGVSLLEPERLAIEERPTRNLEAYEAFLRGMVTAEVTCETQRERIPHLDRAVELDPGLAQAWAGLAVVHSGLMAWCPDSEVDHRARARHALDRALQLAPNSIDTLNVAATFAVRSGDYDGAMAWVEAAGDRIDSSAELMGQKGVILRRQGRWPEAIEEFERALKLDPKSGDLVYTLASSHTWLRNYSDALNYCDQAMLLSRVFPDPYRTKAQAFWLWRGDTQAARTVLERVPDSLANTGRIRWTWFWQEIYEGRYQAALERLDGLSSEGLHTTIHSWPLSLHAALAQQLLGQSDRARKSYEAARSILAARLEAAPGSDSDRRALAIALAGLGRGEEALTQNRLVRELYPLDQRPWFGTQPIHNLALILTMIGDTDGAFEQLEVLLARPALLSIPLLELDPRWAPLRDDPRFEALKLRYSQVDDG